MNKKIPIYFDAIVASPIEKISNSAPSLGRLKVGVFTKYGNRNGSYITDAVAEQLIQSALDSPTPVVGFFDPETQSWAGHTGPTLADAYGYVRSFEGWQPLRDTDGETRDYAVFSVDLFTKYYDEATKIAGQNQSMELDIKSIDGDWADIDNNEYFVYTKARIQGLCIIGSHEPCFSVSAFFSKEDDNYKNQYDKFSSLLSDLRARVEEAEHGGENTMNEFENENIQTVVEEQPVVETQVQEEAPQAEEPVAEFVEEQPAAEPVAEEPAEEDPEPVAEEPAPAVDYEAMYNELLAKHQQLTADYEASQTQVNALTARVAELEQFQNTANTELTDVREQNNQLQSELDNAQNQVKAFELERKNTLIARYKKVLNEEKIAGIESSVADFSYDEIESKLAILFANSNIRDSESTEKVPLLVPEEESSFALLMKKYKK